MYHKILQSDINEVNLFSGPKFFVLKTCSGSVQSIQCINNIKELPLVFSTVNLQSWSWFIGPFGSCKKITII